MFGVFRVPVQVFSALALAATLTLSTPAEAVNPDEVLADPLLEERARHISKNLRCLVCQNQSIDDSDAELAKDLRVLVRERLVAGDSDTDVIDFVVARYGDFVLLKPPVKGATIVLWAGPALFTAIGLFALIFYYRRGPGQKARQTAAAPAALSEKERRRLAELIKDDGA